METAAGGDPPAALTVLRDFPPVFWAAGNSCDVQGTWMLTRAEDMRVVLQDATTYSHDRQFFSPLVGIRERAAAYSSSASSNRCSRSAVA